MNRADRIRLLLEQDPRLLLALVYDLQGNTPDILRPWEPDLGHGDGFLAVRRDLMGDPIVLVRPTKFEGFRGPWAVSPHLPIPDKGLDLRLRQAAKDHNGQNLAYKAVLEAVDRILTKEGYTCLSHTLPDIVLGPWKLSLEIVAPIQWTRDLKVFDRRMCPEFKMSASENGNWRIFREPGDVLTGHTDDLEMAQMDADRMLIRLGYNLCRPTSFAPENTIPKAAGVGADT
jgi:hypothetical protein